MNTRAGLRKFGSKTVIGLLATASVAVGGQVPAIAQVATSRPMITKSHALVTSSSAADLLTSLTKPATPFTIDLSNNYIGNTFRLQMQAEAKVAANMAPFKGVVTVHVVTSQNTVQ